MGTLSDKQTMTRHEPNTDSAISAVLLAAGESRRMGEDNKLLLEVDGEPMVRCTARHLLSAQPSELIVVVGHEAPHITEALRDLPLVIVRNSEYRNGQMTSVHCGLSALKSPCQGVMICLADQPFLTSDDYRAIMDKFRQRRSAKSILVPTHDGRRGNPIVLAHEHCSGILDRKANLGCKHLIDRNPDLVMTVEFSTDRYVRDIDTRLDYRNTVELPPG